jgi:hypothetical protein
MKTILVIFTDTKITSEDQIRRIKKYSFNTGEAVVVGDMLESSKYGTKIQVVRVLDKAFIFYNSLTGDMSDSYISSAQSEILTFTFSEQDQNIVYGKKL